MDNEKQGVKSLMVCIVAAMAQAGATSYDAATVVERAEETVDELEKRGHLDNVFMLAGMTSGSE